MEQIKVLSHTLAFRLRRAITAFVYLVHLDHQDQRDCQVRRVFPVFLDNKESQD